jgi:hypothetical protein
MISGPTPSGQLGEAVGHAVGKLTWRHDLAAGLVQAAPVPVEVPAHTTGRRWRASALSLAFCALQ